MAVTHAECESEKPLGTITLKHLMAFPSTHNCKYLTPKPVSAVLKPVRIPNDPERSPNAPKNLGKPCAKTKLRLKRTTSLSIGCQGPAA